MDRPARHRSRPGVGGGRHLLVCLLRPRGGHQHGQDRPGRGHSAGAALRHLVGQRPQVPRGAAPLPHRRLVVPADRGRRHGTRSQRVRGPQPLAARPLARRTLQPPAVPQRHPPPHPEHGPRGPGGGSRRQLVDGTARCPPPRLHARRARARPRDVPDPGGVGRGRMAPPRARSREPCRPGRAWHPVPAPPTRDDFDKHSLAPHWISPFTRHEAPGRSPSGPAGCSSAPPAQPSTAPATPSSDGASSTTTAASPR